MSEFRDPLKWPKLNQEINSLNRHTANEEIEIVIKCLPNKELQGQMDSEHNSTRHWNYNSYRRFFSQRMIIYPSIITEGNKKTPLEYSNDLPGKIHCWVLTLVNKSLKEGRLCINDSGDLCDMSTWSYNTFPKTWSLISFLLNVGWAQGSQ